MDHKNKIEKIIQFWFAPDIKSQWFGGPAEFDTLIRSHFIDDYWKALDGAYSNWQQNPEGCLAFILLLDQFSRNMFRNDAQAFAADPLAAQATRHALQNKFDLQLPPEQRTFIYMPLMHSEVIEDQTLCVELFKALEGSESNYDYAIRHKQVIERFGRFPHRNKVLGRKSTPEEETFLNSKDAPF